MVPHTAAANKDPGHALPCRACLRKHDADTDWEGAPPTHAVPSTAALTAATSLTQRWEELLQAQSSVLAARDAETLVPQCTKLFALPHLADRKESLFPQC